MIKVKSIVVDAFVLLPRTPITILDQRIADSSPVGWAYLPMVAGLTTLYGLNGAGKSLILSGLEEVLTGVSDWRSHELNPRLLVHAAEGSVQITNNGRAASVSGDVLRLLEEFAAPGESFAGVDAEESAEVGDLLLRAAALLLREAEERCPSTGENRDSSDQASMVARKVAWEIVRQLRFVLSATGESAPAWEVEPTFVRDTDSPFCTELIDSLRRGEGGESQAPSYAIRPLWGDGLVDFDEAKRPAVYQPLLQEAWRTAGLRLPVIGRIDFDIDRATRERFQIIGDLAADAPAVRQMFREQAVVDRDDFILEAWNALASFAFGTPDLMDRVWIEADDLGRLTPESGMRCVADHLEAEANRYYARLLVDAPVLRIKTRGPKDWAVGQLPEWGALRGPSRTWVSLSRLSDAERRWASVAIELALSWQEGGFLLLDEPERALHRSAEAFMARGLTEIAHERSIAVIVATHSPELLNAPDAHVYLVRRSDQGLLDGQQVHLLGGTDRVELRDFGLNPSDLLRRQRGFLLVEGQHDLVVMRELVGHELDDLRIEILPMRGAGKLAATLDSRVLYDFTEAQLFVMLDALRADAVTEVWREGVRLAKTEGTARAVEYVNAAMREMKVDEAGAFGAFLTRALERGMAERHTPLTLSAPDILDYLPVEWFVAEADSWQALREELERSLGAPPSGSKFKSWLRTARKADLSEENIAQACRSLEHVPDEISKQVSAIRATLGLRP